MCFLSRRDRRRRPRPGLAGRVWQPGYFEQRTKSERGRNLHSRIDSESAGEDRLGLWPDHAGVSGAGERRAAFATGRVREVFVDGKAAGGDKNGEHKSKMIV